MPKQKHLDTSQTWTVRRMGKYYKVCSEDGSDTANVTFREYEAARDFANAANAMRIDGETK